MQVIPNSHFWTDLKMLKYAIETYNSEANQGISLKDYLMIGLDNCLKQGYDLRKKTKRKKTK